MHKWERYRAEFVSGKDDRLGLFTWWINLVFLAAALIQVISYNLFEYDLPIFSNTLPLLLAQICDHDPIGRMLMLPFALVCFIGLISTLFTLLTGPRKTRKLGGAMLIVGVIYIIVDLPTLIIAQCLNSPLSKGSFFWIQLFFELLMLASLILKIHIRDKERRKEQPNHA